MLLAMTKFFKILWNAVLILSSIYAAWKHPLYTASVCAVFLIYCVWEARKEMRQYRKELERKWLA
jgi:hypothetical protein